MSYVSVFRKPGYYRQEQFFYFSRSNCAFASLREILGSSRIKYLVQNFTDNQLVIKLFFGNISEILGFSGY